MKAVLRVGWLDLSWVDQMVAWRVGKRELLLAVM
jgi:hypothetical protein